LYSILRSSVNHGLSRLALALEPDTTDTMECVFEELDKPFTENEIETCIKGLNRNKSPGVDNILNEYILDGKTILN
jgi:hypothetical protein